MIVKNSTGNMYLYHQEDLKKQGIKFELTYTVEFTQNKMHYNELMSKGIYDNLNKVVYNNIEESVNFLIKLSDDERELPVLYYQLNLQLKINDLIVLEDSIATFNYTDSTCNKLKNLKFDNEIMSNEIKHYVAFLEQYKANDGFKEFKKANKL